MEFPVTAVLMGGISPEHPVSLKSGETVAKALESLHPGKIIKTVITKEGLWRIGDREAMEPWRALGLLKEMGVECCFLALHGLGGEDGSIQGFLETSKMAYTGSDVSASAVAMSKILTRALLEREGLPMPKGLVIRAGKIGEIVSSVEREIGFPCFFKEEHSGSSLGVFKVSGPDKMGEILAERKDFSHRIVIEESVDGVEVSVGVLGNSMSGLSGLRALPPVEIRPKTREFFDYLAKYYSQETDEICPPKSISIEQVRHVEELAKKVHYVLGCDGVSRVDFIVAKEKEYILECNNIPGMTLESLLPKEAVAAGISFAEFIRDLVFSAMERFESMWGKNQEAGNP